MKLTINYSSIYFYIHKIIDVFIYLFIIHSFLRAFCRKGSKSNRTEEYKAIHFNLHARTTPMKKQTNQP